MPGRPLFCIVLLLVVLDIHAQAVPHPRDAPSNRISPHRIVLHSPVPLSPTERRKLNARIREVGLDSAEELAKEAYQDKGYFKTKVSAELLPLPALGVHSKVLMLQVSPGKQYHLIRVSWRGNKAFSESELANLIQIQPGELFSRTKILAGLNAARKLYESRGYINYICVPTPKTDDEAATLSFEMDVDEGGQFRFGELEAAGMEEAHREILLSAWQGLHGRPYSAEDANEFFSRYFRSPRPNIKPENYLNRKIDEVNHSVDYSLQVVPWLRYRVRGNSLELVETP